MIVHPIDPEALGSRCCLFRGFEPSIKALPGGIGDSATYWNPNGREPMISDRLMGEI